jgi:flagellin-like hook-associated protein FlgL
MESTCQHNFTISLEGQDFDQIIAGLDSAKNTILGFRASIGSVRNVLSLSITYQEKRNTGSSFGSTKT